MRALAIVHQPDAGPGVFADPFARLADWDLVTWMIAEEPEPPADPLGFDAVMTFGGAQDPDQDEIYDWMGMEKRMLAGVLSAQIPVLGVCLGAQLLAAAAGGSPHRTPQPEIGWFEVEVGDQGESDPLLGPLAPRFDAFEWHSYEIPLPPGAVELARSERVLQAYRIGSSAWGIQFHAEVSPEDANCWIVGYRSDRDAVAMQLDWRALLRQTRASIAAWNELGRAMCERFLAAAASRG